MNIILIMKHLLIEGQDCCGKNLLISNLMKQSSVLITKHFGKPEGNTNKEKQDFQKNSFYNEFCLASSKNREMFHMPGKEHEKDLFIWNRSHIGELVYSSLYRDTHDNEWVIEMEKEFKMNSDPEVYLILLVAYPEFLINNDDGNSFSNDIENKRKELDMFIKAFNKSTILNKKFIHVNEKDENGLIKFRLEQDIINEVNNFLW